MKRKKMKTFASQCWDAMKQKIHDGRDYRDWMHGFCMLILSGACSLRSAMAYSTLRCIFSPGKEGKVAKGWEQKGATARGEPIQEAGI